MGQLTGRNRCVRKTMSAVVMMATNFTLAAALGFAATPGPETIQATYSQSGNPIGVTLIVYKYSTPSDLQILSQAYQKGQDRGLATALSKTKAMGRCIVAGDIGYDIAFIQVVLTPTGRQIVFITSRPHPSVESDPPATQQTFDLAVGQFDLNDTDSAKSTGFLFPASKLVVDEQGEFHYDLAGTSWALSNVLDSNGTPPLTAPQVADASRVDLGKDQARSSGH